MSIQMSIRQLSSSLWQLCTGKIPETVARTDECEIRSINVRQGEVGGGCEDRANNQQRRRRSWSSVHIQRTRPTACNLLRSPWSRQSAVKAFIVPERCALSSGRIRETSPWHCRIFAPEVGRLAGQLYCKMYSGNNAGERITKL